MIRQEISEEHPHPVDAHIIILWKIEIEIEIGQIAAATLDDLNYERRVALIVLAAY